MLMLLFRVGETPWAIAASEVREVVPLVALQAMAQGWSDASSRSSSRLAGLMNYHGETIPVVDVSALLSGQAAEQTLNTRIVVVEADEVTDEPVGQTRQRVGLVLPNVSETTQLLPVANIPTASCYVQSTWQFSEADKVVYQLAIAPILKQVYQLEAASTMASNRRQSDLLEAVSQTSGLSQRGA